jgi:uncharacterized protein YutE (UPF0331/DUF86 family)
MEGFDAIGKKLVLLDGYQQRLISLQKHDLEEFLNDQHLQWSVEHRLQLSIQCVIDVSQALIRKKGLTCPSHAVDVVALLAEQRLVSRELGEKLVSMVRFRNVVVHAYDHVRPDVVHQCLMTRLGDFDLFAKQILDHIDGVTQFEDEEVEE